MMHPLSLRDYFPLGTSLTFVVGTAAAGLVLWHLVFVVWTPTRLTKRGWRIVDYAWLLVGGLALIGGVGQARQAVAGAVLAQSDERIQTAYRRAREVVLEAAKSDGYLCEYAEQDEWTPREVFEARNRSRSVGCAWAQQLASSMPEQYPPGGIPADLLRVPSVPDQAVKDSLHALADQSGYVSEDIAALSYVRAAASRNRLETNFATLSPLLLAVALSLRITKVTGEWMIEVRAVRVSQAVAAAATSTAPLSEDVPSSQGFV